MSTRRKTPTDLAAVKKSRSSYNGAITRAADKVKAMKCDEAETIALINPASITKILSSIQRTEDGFLQTIEDAKEFTPEGEGEDAFYDDEDAAYETFTDSISAVRAQADTLLKLSTVLTGLSELTSDIKAIETSLAEDPRSVHSTSLHLLESNLSKLRLTWREANLPKEHPLKGELDASKKILMNLTAKIVNAEHGTTSSTSSTPVSSHRVERDRTKLPAIALPSFKGDILQWPTFWQKFSAAVDCHDDLPESTKLAYLRTSIQDPEAELILNPSMDGPDTYRRLVKELHQRYERAKKIHRELVEKLINLPPAKNNSKDLRRLVDATNNCIECLQVTEHFDLESVLTSLTYNKLPYKVQIDWDNDHADDGKVLPYTKLLEYVTKKAFTLSDHKSSSSTQPVDPPEKKTPRSQEKKQPQRQKSFVHAVSSPSPSPAKPPYKWECSLCHPEKHPLHLCSKWAGFTLQQRLNHVKNKSLCSNCLGVGHTTATCKSTYRCRDCQQPHHTSLHKETASQVNSTIIQSQQVPDALLMTAEVLLKGPGGQELKARAFLDPGASISLISSRITQILDLPLEPNKINFTGAQGTPCKGAKYLTAVTISPLHYKKEIECRPAVVQLVTDNIPSRPMAPASEFHHLIGLRLADPNFNLPARVDILLGADLWLQLQTGAAPVTASASEPGAQSTIFGWAITGPATHQGEDTLVISTHHIQTTIPWDQHAEQIHNFWLSEDTCPPEKSVSELDKYVEQQYEDNVTYSASNQRYQVALPKNPDCQPLGESRPQAEQRFYSNEKSINRKKVESEFNGQIQTYLDLQHAEKVPAAELQRPHYYLPMHFVTKSSSTSTKLRVVFDGSAQTSTGVSLTNSSWWALPSSQR